MTSESPSNFNPNEPVQFSKPLYLSPGEDLLGYISDLAGRFILFMITSASVLAVLLIFGFVIREAVPFITKHGVIDFITSIHWFPQADGAKAEFGALAIITGTLYVTTAALFISVPLGLLAAVFLSDIAPFKVRQICKPIIEILAVIPSVAYGFFAVMVLAPWMQEHLGFTTGTNALNASIILSIMALPTIISVSEDSLSAVGRDIREASFSLGATRAESVIQVVIPSAHSGIIAGVILGMMRAIGETMVVWMASGNASQIPHPWWDLSQSIRTMTATIAGELGETPRNTDHYYVLFAVGLLLLVFTFTLNMISEFFLARFKRRREVTQ